MAKRVGKAGKKGGGAHDERRGRQRRLSAMMAPMTRRAFARHGFHHGALLTEWPEIVGARLAACCVPVRFSATRDSTAGTLTVRVAGAEALRVQHEEPVILEKIAAYVGFRAVTRIKIIQGPMPEAPTPRPLPRPLAADEERGLADMVAPVADTALNEALERLGRAILGRRPSDA